MIFFKAQIAFQIKQLLNYVSSDILQSKIWRKIDIFFNVIGILLIDMLESVKQTKVINKIICTTRDEQSLKQL